MMQRSVSEEFRQRKEGRTRRSPDRKRNSRAVARQVFGHFVDDRAGGVWPGGSRTENL